MAYPELFPFLCAKNMIAISRMFAFLVPNIYFMPEQHKNVKETVLTSWVGI